MLRAFINLYAERFERKLVHDKNTDHRGGTAEKIDKARQISNNSVCTLGYAIAESFLSSGGSTDEILEVFFRKMNFRKNRI